jgi:hypothetical protein
MFYVGRRVPKSWYRRAASKISGLISFQENLWFMITEGIKKAKKKADAYGGVKFDIKNDVEPEDLHYEIHWRKVQIQASPEIEADEYKDILKMYDKFSKSFKKEYAVDNNLANHFKTKVLNSTQLKEAYAEGYGAMENNNIANKLLEMGILTHVELIKDYDNREFNL